MYKGLHGLVYAADSHVDSMLYHAVVALDSNELPLEIVVDLHIIKTSVVLTVDLSDLVEFLLECPSYERRHVEVECRDRLTSMHLVLNSLKRDASEDAGCLDSFSRA